MRVRNYRNNLLHGNETKNFNFYAAAAVAAAAACFLDTVCVTFFIDTVVKDDQIGLRFLF